MTVIFPQGGEKKKVSLRQLLQNAVRFERTVKANGNVPRQGCNSLFAFAPKLRILRRTIYIEADFAPEFRQTFNCEKWILHPHHTSEGDKTRRAGTLLGILDPLHFVPETKIGSYMNHLLRNPECTQLLEHLRLLAI